MSDTHMDMVTVATFHPLQPHLFFSGSDDGLIAAFDFSQGLSEDDGFMVCCSSLWRGAQFAYCMQRGFEYVQPLDM